MSLRGVAIGFGQSRSPRGRLRPASAATGRTDPGGRLECDPDAPLDHLRLNGTRELEPRAVVRCRSAGRRSSSAAAPACSRACTSAGPVRGCRPADSARPASLACDLNGSFSVARQTSWHRANLSPWQGAEIEQSAGVPVEDKVRIVLSILAVGGHAAPASTVERAMRRRGLLSPWTARASAASSPGPAGRRSGPAGAAGPGPAAGFRRVRGLWVPKTCATWANS
jgi:hypothetical protein